MFSWIAMGYKQPNFFVHPNPSSLVEQSFRIGPRHRRECTSAQSSPSSYNVNMIATPPPVEPHTPEQSLPTCSVLPQPVADGRTSVPIEASSAHSNIAPKPRGAIPKQSTTTDIGQDSRPALPPRHLLLHPLLKVSFALFNSL